ncbi:MAG: hypothetical protein JJE04_27675 [Acidobacteriia bacterium]|nr:hypothetical protein [Terriglobia bacterium]
MQTGNGLRSGASARRRSGVTAIQMLTILVPVLFGFMGFAIDLGRLYMIRGELKVAANSIALAAAQQLAGSDISSEDAAAAAQLAAREAGGFSNKYDYAGRAIGEESGTLTSTVTEPTYYETVESALGAGETGGAEASGGSTSKHVKITIQAEAPLIFWSLLSLGVERKTPIIVDAVAGMSAPLCTACNIEPIAIAALDQEDTTDFGMVVGTRYTLGYVCNGNGAPVALAGTTQRLTYLMINRLNEEAELFPDELTQSYRIGGAGLPSSNLETVSCLNINAAEAIWASAAPLACTQNRVPGPIQAFTCGLATRFEAGVYSGCESVPEIESATIPLLPDTDVADVEDYLTYTGNRRRIITIPIVDSLSDPQAMTVLGFRQFLVQPLANTANIDPLDNNGRFIASYIGSSVPLKQGRFSGCTVTTGPGKVVLHK